MTMRARRAASSMPSSRSNSHDRFCCAIRRRCRRLASLPITPWRCASCWSRWLRRRPSSSASHSCVGLDDLVELDGIGVILLAQRLVGERTRRQPRTLGAARLLLVAGAHLHLGLGLVGGGLGGVFLLGSVLGLFALGAVALGLAGIAVVVAGLVRLTVGVLLVLRVLVVVVLQVRRFVAELEVADELASGPGEGFLVGQRFLQLLEVAAGGGSRCRRATGRPSPWPIRAVACRAAARGRSGRSRRRSAHRPWT